MNNTFKDLAFYAFIAVAVYFIYKYIIKGKDNTSDSTSNTTVTSSGRTASGTATPRTTANGSGVSEQTPDKTASLEALNILTAAAENVVVSGSSERTTSGTATSRRNKIVTYDEQHN